jgi:hypothetical protein
MFTRKFGRVPDILRVAGNSQGEVCITAIDQHLSDYADPVPVTLGSEPSRSMVIVGETSAGIRRATGVLGTMSPVVAGDRIASPVTPSAVQVPVTVQG